jgi:hypothetical protein
LALSEEDEELLEALFGTYRRAVMPPAVLVLAGLVVPLAAFAIGLAIGTARAFVKAQA